MTPHHRHLFPMLQDCLNAVLALCRACILAPVLLGLHMRHLLGRASREDRGVPGMSGGLRLTRFLDLSVLMTRVLVLRMQVSGKCCLGNVPRFFFGWWYDVNSWVRAKAFLPWQVD